MFVRTDISDDAALEERRNIHVEPRATGEWRKENEKLIVRLGLHKLVIQGRSAPWGARFVPSPHGTKRLHTDRILLVVYHNLGKGDENPPLLSRHNYQRRCNAVKNKRLHTSWQNHTFSDPVVSAESVVSRGKRRGYPSNILGCVWWPRKFNHPFLAGDDSQSVLPSIKRFDCF